MKKLTILLITIVSACVTVWADDWTDSADGDTQYNCAIIRQINSIAGWQPYTRTDDATLTLAEYHTIVAPDCDTESEGQDSEVVWRIAHDTHGMEGLIEPITLPSGLYRYEMVGISYSSADDLAKASTNRRPEYCAGMAFFDRFDRFVVEEDKCRIYFTVTNRDKLPWSITITLEE